MTQVMRAFALDDVAIRADGDGRTVEAYCAAWGVESEIRDADGHYVESLERGAFSKTIGERGPAGFGVFYNHARTIYGTPDGALSVPIGVPLEVREDERGVWTVTRYLDNPLADSVLDAIKQRAIRGQSFSGRFLQTRWEKPTTRGGLRRAYRTEVAMREYGPTVFPAYAEAAIVGTRSVEAFLDELSRSAEDKARLADILGVTTPVEPVASFDTPTGAVATAEPATSHSSRQFHHNRVLARREGGPLA